MYNNYYTNYDYSNIVSGVADFFGVFLAVLVFLLLISCVISIILIVSYWKILKKGGKPGWATLIPIYNVYELCSMVGVSPFWILIIIFSGLLSAIHILGGLLSLAANIYFIILLNVSLARSFKKSDSYAVGLILLPVIFYPMLGLGSATYVGKHPMKDFLFKSNNIDKNNNIGCIFSFIGGLIGGLVGGLLLVFLIIAIILPGGIITFNEGTNPVLKVNGTIITSDDLYEQMKQDYNISYFIEYIDKTILDKKYAEDDKMKEEVEKTAQNYFDMYEQYYQMDEGDFLAQNGFENKEQFLEALKLEYRRKLYYYDYLKTQITDEQIQKYYDEKVLGDMNTQHILVQINGNMNETAAKKIAEEIIDKLNDGQSFDEVRKEYYDKIIYEDLKYVAFNAELDETFLEALKKLPENSYSKTPVKTSYGYHVIYKKDQKDKPSLADVKDRIIEELCYELDVDDEKLYNKSLLKMREEAGLEFLDPIMKEKYEEYIEDFK